jgi:hypothetical protein
LDWHLLKRGRNYKELAEPPSKEKRRAREQQLELQQAPPALESPRSPVTAVGGGTAGAMRQAGKQMISPRKHVIFHQTNRGWLRNPAPVGNYEV